MSTIFMKHRDSRRFLIYDIVVEASLRMSVLDSSLLISFNIESLRPLLFVSISPSTWFVRVFSTKRCNKAKSRSKGLNGAIESRSII